MLKKDGWHIPAYCKIGAKREAFVCDVALLKEGKGLEVLIAVQNQLSFHQNYQ